MHSCLALVLNELSSTKRISYEDFLSNSSSVLPLAAAFVAANSSKDGNIDVDYEQDEEEEEEEEEEEKDQLGQQLVKRRRVEVPAELSQNILRLEQQQKVEFNNIMRLNRYRTYPPISDIEDSSFREHFGMNKTLMEKLFREIHAMIFSTEDYRRGKGFFVPSPKKVLLTVWILCTRESFREVADRFHMSKGGLHFSFINICLLLKRNSQKFIRWPNIIAQRTTAMNVESKYGFPGVVGAVGECVIKNCIKCGSKVSSSIVVLQGVCDASQRFFNTFVSDTTDIPLSRVFLETPLFSRLCADSFVGGDFHLLGDCSYPLMNNLLVPFENDGVLTNERSEYNRIHDETYDIIRKTFARLVGRFKRLDNLHMSRGDLVTTVVHGVCCLHNFIVVHEDLDSLTEYDLVFDDMQHSAFVSETMCSKAIEKRDLIASLLYSRASK